MPWTPSTSLLRSIDEDVNFVDTITYTEIDPILLTETEYLVTITANQENPTSVSISGNKISGFYHDSFDYTLKYRTFDGQLPVVNKFSDIKDLHEMVSYRPSLSRSKTFSYTAVAKNTNGVVVATNTYTVTVTNNWSVGENALKALVGATLLGISKDFDIRIVSWGSGVKFINESNQEVKWENNL